MSFGERLRALRQATGMTQQQLADSLHMLRTTYAYYELGKTFPDTPTLMRIAELHGVSVDYLFSDYHSEEYRITLRDRSVASYTAPCNGSGDAGWELTGNEQRLLAAFRRLGEQEQKQLVQQTIATAFAQGDQSVTKQGE